jgi:hypothetical protein
MPVGPRFSHKFETAIEGHIRLFLQKQHNDNQDNDGTKGAAAEGKSGCGCEFERCSCRQLPGF